MEVHNFLKNLIKMKRMYSLKWKGKYVSTAHNVILDNNGRLSKEKGKVFRQEKIISLLSVSQKLSMLSYNLEKITGHEKSVD